MGTTFMDLRQRSILRLILGGAAVHRCDKQHISNVALAAAVILRRERYFFRSRLS